MNGILNGNIARYQVVKSGFKDEATVYGCTGALLTAVFEGSFFD